MVQPDGLTSLQLLRAPYLVWFLFLNNAIVWEQEPCLKTYQTKENMDRRLQIQIDNRKVVKNSEGNDVELLFSLVMPYGVPFPLAREALEELMADFTAMQEAAEKALKDQEAAKAVSEPDKVEAAKPEEAQV